RCLDADEIVDHILEDPLGRARLRVLPAAPAALPEAEHRALLRVDARTHDADLELVGPAPVVDQPAAERRQAALPAPDGLDTATPEHRERRVAVRELE